MCCFSVYDKYRLMLIYYKYSTLFVLVIRTLCSSETNRLQICVQLIGFSNVFYNKALHFIYIRDTQVLLFLLCYHTHYLKSTLCLLFLTGNTQYASR